MLVVLDDIIYSRQLNGGISVYWKEITRSIRNNIQIRKLTLNNKKSILFDVSYKLAEPHIFHSSYFRTSRNKNALNVLTVHDCIHRKRNNLRNLVFHFFLKNKLKKSCLVICESNTTRNDLYKYYRKNLPKRVKVIYNGVDSNFKNLKLKREKKILFIGDRSWYKNFAYSIKISKFLNYPLVIIGKPLSKKEFKLIESFGIQFIVLSNVTTEKLIHLYNTVSFLVYCSDFEGFGIPLIEAARCKCPVITLDKPFVNEVLGDNTIKVSEDSFEEIINHVKDENLMKQLTLGAYNKSLNYDWNKSSKELVSVYESILSKQKNN